MLLRNCCKFVAPLALFSINTLKEITSIERLCNVCLVCLLS